MARKAVKTRLEGFTLSELLIALAILGVIATFTIPKVLQSQQDGRNKAIAKEAVAMVYGAYDTYRMKNTVTSGFSLANLTPYMNYVKVLNGGEVIDSVETDGEWVCDATYPCLRLHNGALFHYTLETFGGTASTNALYFHVDPDGVVNDVQAVPLFLYYSGKLTDEGNLLPGTANSAATFPATPAHVPPWFSWN